MLEGVSPCRPSASHGRSAADDRTLIRYADRVLHRPTEANKNPTRKGGIFVWRRGRDSNFTDAIFCSVF